MKDDYIMPMNVNSGNIKNHVKKQSVKNNNKIITCKQHITHSQQSELQNEIEKALNQRRELLGELSPTLIDYVTRTVEAEFKQRKAKIADDIKPKAERIYKKAERIYKKAINSKEYRDTLKAILDAKENGENSITVDHRYSLPSTLAAKDAGVKILISKQEMSTGKSFTWALIAAFDSNVKKSLSICSLKSVNTSNAISLTEQIEIPFEAYTDTKDQGYASSNNILSSVNSLSKTTSLFGGTSFDNVLIDESEAMATFLLSPILKYKHEAISALKDVINNSGFVVFADAHAGYSTERMIRYLAPEKAKDVFTIHNTYQHWRNVDGYEINNIDAGLKHNMQAIAKGLATGEKIASYYASAKDAEAHHKKIKEKFGFTDEEYPLITSETAANEFVAEIKNDTNKFKNTKGFCASSSIGVGLSIKVEGFTTSYLYAKNSDLVGNSKSALQMPFRTRYTKKLVLVVCEDSRMASGYREVLFNELKDYDKYKGYRDIITSALADNMEAREAWEQYQNKHNEYAADIRAEQIRDVLTYFERIKSTLSEKGIKLKKINVDMSEDDMGLTSKQKKEIKQQRIDRLKETKVIDSKVAKSLMSQKTKDDGLSQEAQEQLTVYTVAKNCIAHDVDVVSEEAIKAFDNGAISKRDRVELALLPKADINMLIDAKIDGVNDGDKICLKLDMLDTRPAVIKTDWEHDNYLLSLLGITSDKNISGSFNIDGMHKSSRDRIVRDLNNLIDARNTFKLNGMLSSKIVDDGNINRQMKRIFDNRLNIKMKPAKKIPAINVPRSTLKNKIYEKPLMAVFGSDRKGKIRAKNGITAEYVMKSALDQALTDEIMAEANSKKGYKVTVENARKNPLRVLRRILKLAGVEFKNQGLPNGYTVKNVKYDAQHMADIANEKCLTGKLVSDIEYIKILIAKNSEK